MEVPIHLSHRHNGFWGWGDGGKEERKMKCVVANNMLMSNGK